MTTVEVQPCTIETPGLRFSGLRAGEGPLVLVLHGFPDHAPSMIPLVVALAQAGFTAVAPYLRGYAPSAPAPDGRYDVATLGRDVPALVHSLGFTRTHIVGHDWGAAIAYSAAIQAPSCVASLVAMAVPPLRQFLGGLVQSPTQLRRSSYMARLQLPEHFGGGTSWLCADDFAAIDFLWSRWSPGFTPPRETIAAVKRTFRAPGTAAAAVAYYRQLLPGTVGLTEYARAMATLLAGRCKCPGLLLTGTRDGCIGSELFSGAQTSFSDTCTVLEIAEAGHFLHLEQPVTVHRIILDFLTTQP